MDKALSLNPALTLSIFPLLIVLHVWTHSAIIAFIVFLDKGWSLPMSVFIIREPYQVVSTNNYTLHTQCVRYAHITHTGVCDVLWAVPWPCSEKIWPRRPTPDHDREATKKKSSPWPLLWCLMDPYFRRYPKILPILGDIQQYLVNFGRY